MANATFEIPKLEVPAFDTRLQRRHINQGRITSKEVEKHLKGLPDEADAGEEITVYLGEDPPAEVAEIPEA